MHTGEVIHLFQGKRGNRAVKRDALRHSLSRAWTRVTTFATAVADVARESRALETRLLDQRSHRRFIDR